MNKIFILIFFIFSNFLSLAMADDALNDTLILTLENHSNSNFQFTGISDQNPTNTFTTDTALLTPGSTMTITATTDSSEDLAGVLNFKDNNGISENFIIIDPRIFHILPPTFDFEGNNLISTIKSKTPDASHNGRSLMIVDADVVISNA